MTQSLEFSATDDRPPLRFASLSTSPPIDEGEDTPAAPPAPILSLHEVGRGAERSEAERG
jgi:hypothetical protein